MALGMLGGIVNAATGGLLNAAFAPSEDQRQREQQDYFNREQIKGAKEMGAFNAQQSLAMMKAQYKAQVDGMKEAGLSVSNMYGKGGQGGVTVPTSMPQGGQASGAAATGANAIQLGMMQQQAELTKAQTEKVKAETQQIGGAQTDVLNTQASSIAQGINNQKAAEELTKAQASLTKAQAEVANGTIQDAISRIQYEANEAVYRASSAMSQANVDVNTQNEKIQILKNTAAQQLVEIAAKKSQINLNQKQIEEITNSIEQKWEGVKQNWKNTDIRKFTEEVKANYPSLMQMGGHGLQQIIYGITDMFTGERGDSERANRTIKFQDK